MGADGPRIFLGRQLKLEAIENNELEMGDIWKNFGRENIVNSQKSINFVAAKETTGITGLSKKLS